MSVPLPCFETQGEGFPLHFFSPPAHKLFGSPPVIAGDFPPQSHLPFMVFTGRIYCIIIQGGGNVDGIGSEKND